MKLDEDVRSSCSQDSPSMIEESEDTVVPNIDPTFHDESDSSVDEVRLGSDMPSPSTPVDTRLRWLTETSQDVEENVGVPKFSMKANIPPRRYVSHVALFSSIYEPSS
jgi:hypothetical protein